MNFRKIIFALGVSVVSYFFKANAQIYVPDSNLISNGYFMSRDPQHRPLHWISGQGQQTVILSPETRHPKSSGDNSLEATDTSAIYDLLIRTEKIIAIPGARYSAGAWAKTDVGDAAHFNLEFWDQNNKIIGSQSVSAASGRDWQRISTDLQAPDKCTHLTISISSGTLQTGRSYWDDVTLTYKHRYDPALKKGVRELFMDDYRIEELVDVIRQVNPAVKSRILINPTEPWEGNSVYIYGTVLQGEPKGSGYRMWYTSYVKEKYYLCYATSKDGINWVKPRLGLIEFMGSKENNICRVGGGSVIYDAAEKDSTRRYKLMSYESDKSRSGYNVFFSPDGFHWTVHSKPVLPYGDVSNIAFDKEKGLYIATTKQRMYTSNTSVTPGKNDRSAFVSVSRDFVNWSAPGAPNSSWVLAVEGDNADDQLVMSKGGLESNVYGMPVYPYEGAYIGLPWMFDIMTYDTGEFASYGDGKIQPQIAFSRDLKSWSRLIRDPVIPLGKSGAWDDGTLYTSSTMQVSDKEMSIYYGAMNLPHGGSIKTQTQYARIAKASWRRDGMVSLYNAGDDAGTIITKPIICSGTQLKVNTKLNAGGNLKVEILDNKGNVIEGYSLADSKPLKKDQFEALVQWENTALSRLKGKEIKLRFSLKGGHLYSFWFE